MVPGEGVDLSPEAVPDLLDHRGGGDRLAEVSLAEPLHLATDLQIGNVGVEVEAVDACQLEPNVTVQDVVDVDRIGHHPTPVVARAGEGIVRRATLSRTGPALPART